MSVQGRTLYSRPEIETAIAQIEDLVGTDGHIMTYVEFTKRHPGVRVNPLTYMGWCQTIPSRWKWALIGSSPLSEEERSERPVIVIKGKEVAVELIKCGYFYFLQIPNVTPTAQNRWTAAGTEFDNWKTVYERAFNVTASSKLQSLQFRIIHRYFPTRKFLFTRNVIEDPFCDNCGQVDTLEHYFFACEEVKELWLKIAAVVNARGISLRITLKDVLFGSAEIPDVVNLIILVAKQFIVNQNYRDGSKELPGFCAALSKMFNMEKCIAMKHSNKEKFRKRWAPFIDRNDTLF